MVVFSMPESERDVGSDPFVDAVSLSEKGTVASKCFLHGLIYVWDLEASIKAKERDAETETGDAWVDVKVTAKLRWSDTEEVYMNIGCHKGDFYPATFPSSPSMSSH